MGGVTTVTPALPGYDDVLTRWEPVVGLETHVELGTASKMFCGCATGFGAEPNTQTCPVCLGLPGSLPVVNEAAVRFTVMIGLALHCDIAPWCRFARKNYFYPDMPKDFQISQYDEPLCTDGWLDVTDPTTGEIVRVGIERVHMEEDTGKSLHVGGATGRIQGADHSLLDYNRAGIPLVEIVTRPDMRSPEVARAYVAELRDLLRSLGVSDVRMEQGSLRCDVNTSLRPKGTEPLGARTETKNVNSLRSVERAVRHEVARQAGLLEAGTARVYQETRHWHEDTATTSAGRSKEEATDYRYFPEPDLVPLALDAAYVEGVRSTLPETPTQRRERLVTVLGFAELDVRQMAAAGALDLVEETVALGAPASDARAVWMNDVATLANERGVEIADLGVSADDVAAVIALRGAGTISAAGARTVLRGVADGEGAPGDIVAARGLEQVSDAGELERWVAEAIAAQPDAAEKVRAGKVAAAGALVGAVMKSSGRKANAAAVRALVLAALGAGPG